MSKKGKGRHSEEKIKGNLFDEDDEEDNKELKKLNSLFSQSKENITENDDDNNNDLNNKTNVSDRDNIYENEIKDTSIKTKENNPYENELSEIFLKSKNSFDFYENSILKSDEGNFEINKKNKNININLFINEIEPNINKNIKKQNQIINKNVLVHNDDLLNEKKELEEENENNQQKKKAPIFLIRKIKKRSKKIQFLRKKKGIRLIRKNSSDIIRKKIKTYFHNYLINKLNNEIETINLKKFSFNSESYYTSKKVKKKGINKFLKFNNKFTTNVSINLNEKLLIKKISQILIEEPISSKYKSFQTKNNIFLTKYLLSLKHIPNIHKLLNSTYKQCYEEFLESSEYKKISDDIKLKDGIQYWNNFQKVCLNLTSFYNKEKQKNSPEKKKPNKKIFLIQKIKHDKEDSKKSKKSKRSISSGIFNRTQNISGINKFKNSSSFYISSINSKNNIISLNEDISFNNIISKGGSEHSGKSCFFINDINGFSNNSIYKEYERNYYDILGDKMMDDMNNLSII